MRLANLTSLSLTRSLPAPPSTIRSRDLTLLHWVNDDLNTQVFCAVKCCHGLAAMLRYEDLNAADAALATQASGDGTSQRLSLDLTSPNYP